MNCVIENRCIMLNFLNLTAVLWLFKRMALVLEGEYKYREEVMVSDTFCLFRKKKKKKKYIH